MGPAAVFLSFILTDLFINYANRVCIGLKNEKKGELNRARADR